jgi:hypothetical protein
MNKINEYLVEDLIRLRDEISQRAFDRHGDVVSNEYAEVFYKINSCLYKGYPRRATAKTAPDEDSWAKNPDRSGGAFTQQEIEDSGKWT